jgi:hypothetical protein
MTDVDPSLRDCFLQPIPEIFAAAESLRLALQAHLDGDGEQCAELIRRADDPKIAEWTRPFLGPWRKNPHLQLRTVQGAPPTVAKPSRVLVRMPTAAEKAELIRWHGRNCAFCGIPLVRAEVRKAFTAAYPEAARWGSTNDGCHAAFLCMWLQYDHLLPHSRGGDNSTDNVVLTCSACNFGRMAFTLQEVGLVDPRTRASRGTDWEGLEAMLTPRLDP